VPARPALDPTAEGRAWVDVDGDALPDLLDGQPGAWRYRKNIGGQISPPPGPRLPSPAAALGPTARFADLTGDGVQDLLAQPGPRRAVELRRRRRGPVFEAAAERSRSISAST
jgi:hypothetical protein